MAHDREFYRQRQQNQGQAAALSGPVVYNESEGQSSGGNRAARREMSGQEEVVALLVLEVADAYASCTISIEQAKSWLLPGLHDCLASGMYVAQAEGVIDVCRAWYWRADYTDATRIFNLAKTLVEEYAHHARAGTVETVGADPPLQH